MSLEFLGRLVVFGLPFIVLAACSATVSELDDDDSEPTEVTTPSPDVDPTSTPTAAPAPTAVPSGSMLVIDGLPVRQVVIRDSTLPAEYAATEVTLFRRTDSRTWRRVGSMPAFGRLAGDPQNPDVLYLGDHPPCLREGDPVPFHRSMDGGASWEQIEEATNIRPILVWPDNPEILVGSRCGLAISQDRGENWEVHDERMGSLPVEHVKTGGAKGLHDATD